MQRGALIIVVVIQLALRRAAQRRLDYKAELARRRLLCAHDIISGATTERDVCRTIHEFASITCGVMVYPTADAAELP